MYDIRKKEIRGKRKDNGEWVYGIGFTTEKGNDKDAVLITADGDEYVVVIETLGIQAKRLDVMEDKNGKAIFDGDVLAIEGIDGVFVVGINDDNQFVMRNGDVELNFYDFDSCTTEVIGNIYDNPDLLK